VLRRMLCAQRITSALSSLDPRRPSSAVRRFKLVQRGRLAGGANRGGSMPKLPKDGSERVAALGLRSAACIVALPSLLLCFGSTVHCRAGAQLHTARSELILASSTGGGRRVV